MTNKKTLGTFELILLSTGGMIGTGWLFSPYYGFESAGAWVILSWIITAFLIFLIALTFAEVVSSFPLAGGFMRYLDLTHSKSLGFLIITIGWLSYVVYLPLESQGTIQYLGYWLPQLVYSQNGKVTLSIVGTLCAIAIMLILTLFNMLHINKVAKTNMGISLWKIILPIVIAFIIIIYYGSTSTFSYHANTKPFNMNNILLAITSSGLAFAFTGFQNGLILANNAKNPHKSLPLSVIFPIIIGLTMYASLSLAFMFGLPPQSTFNATAPLLGILGLLSLNYLSIYYFICRCNHLAPWHS
ncbi:APC family permease [Cysteiniphilum halobium]|uniref:APC family permease n=1 Tax=Cysteiniphilum halobium TaxID=2219059 RepID=UPI000E652FC6|nr:APC family permease [Cysteiniphilum halobium]